MAQTVAFIGLGSMGAGMAPPATAVGHPSTYFEWYGSLPQVYMAHIMSLVTEGVFDVPVAYWDLFRVADGRIVEHWDIVAPIPDTLPHDNGLF